MPSVIYANPITTAPTSTKQPSNVQQDAPRQFDRPIDYHAQPKNTPPIQRSINNGDFIPRPDILPRNSSVSPPQRITGNFAADFAFQGAGNPGFEALSSELASELTFYGFGVFDGFRGTTSYAVEAAQTTINEDVFYSGGLESGKKLRDLWENRPDFEIPTIQIPKFDRPGMPDFKIPKIPEFNPPPKPQDKPIPGQPKPTTPEPEQKPQPTTKEKDIPTLREPEPKPFVPKPGRYKLPQLCNCGASIVIGFHVTVDGLQTGDDPIIAGGGGVLTGFLKNEETPGLELNSIYGTGAGSGRGTNAAQYFDYSDPNMPVQTRQGTLNNKSSTTFWKELSFTQEEIQDGYISPTLPRFKTDHFDAATQTITSKLVDAPWEIIHVTCIGCEPHMPKESPPPPPPEDCDCMAKCCPDIDYRKLQKIIEEEVKKLDVTAAIPLSFQIRHEGDTPQMVIQCAERKSAASGDKAAKDASAMYPITVPHWRGGQNDKPSLPPYKKGNWEGILVLVDNSKVTINAQNEAECIKILNAIKPWIDKKMLSGSYFKGGKIKPKVPIKETQVYPRYGRYFANGQKNNKPDWRVDFP